jgi:hypothetical protein
MFIYVERVKIAVGNWCKSMASLAHAQPNLTKIYG